MAELLINGKVCNKTSFDVTTMRDHLRKCLKNQVFTTFPTVENIPSPTVVQFSTTSSNVDMPIYCVCRMPYHKDENMVECSKCKNWYHKQCENIPETVIDNIKTKWYCSKCNEGKKGN